MTSGGVEVRYERKFVLSDPGPHAALALVRAHPALFREEFPPRAVNSLYLDSPGRRRYYEHCAGVGRRAKLRIRWYAALFGAVAAPQLELKQREGACSVKHCHPLGAFVLDETFDSAPLLSGLRRAPLPGAFLSELVDVEPVLIVRFRRRYFRSADRRIRITIDAGMEFHRCCGRGGSFLPRAAAPGLVVLEIKYAVPDAPRAGEIANGFPFRAARMSKYVLGAELLRAV